MSEENTVKCTFDGILKEIKAMRNPNFHDCKAIISIIAAARLAPVECDVLSAHLRNHWPDPAPSRMDIKTDIKAASKRLTGKASGYSAESKIKGHQPKKHTVAFYISYEMEDYLVEVGAGKKSIGLIMCVEFWKEHHSNDKPAPPVDDESVRESVGFLDD